jgi:guanylate kinase
MLKKIGKLFVISGPSGAGKSSLIDDALKGLNGFIKSISVTTRPRRNCEKDGIKYNFVSKEKFEKLINEDKFLEFATYCDFLYGTPKDFVEEQLNSGKNVILEIEINGAMQIKEKIKDAFLIFITTPSFSQLKERLKKRGTESITEIEKRLIKSEDEIKYLKYYDCIIVNNNYNKALLNLKNILDLQKEK